MLIEEIRIDSIGCILWKISEYKKSVSMWNKFWSYQLNVIFKCLYYHYFYISYNLFSGTFKRLAPLKVLDYTKVSIGSLTSYPSEQKFFLNIIIYYTGIINITSSSHVSTIIVNRNFRVYVWKTKQFKWYINITPTVLMNNDVIFF